MICDKCKYKKSLDETWICSTGNVKGIMSKKYLKKETCFYFQNKNKMDIDIEIIKTELNKSKNDPYYRLEIIYNESTLIDKDIFFKSNEKDKLKFIIKILKFYKKYRNIVNNNELKDDFCKLDGILDIDVYISLFFDKEDYYGLCEDMENIFYNSSFEFKEFKLSFIDANGIEHDCNIKEVYNGVKI